MAKSATGGALRGLGAALVRRSENEREDKLRSQDRAHEDEMALREQAFQRGQQIRQDLMRKQEVEGARADRIAADTAERVSRENEVMDVIPGDNREAQAVTRSGQHRGLGFHMAPTTAGAADPFPEQEWKAVVQRFTTKDPDTGYDKTDWSGVADTFKQMGNTQLAELAMSSMREPSNEIDVQSDQYQKAEEQADAWIGNQASWFSRDSSDFKQFGGNREDARQAKIMEFYNQLTGRGGKPSAGQGRPAAGGAGGGGAGTQDSPANPKSQAEYDALGHGAYYIDPDDGQLYRKR